MTGQRWAIRFVALGSLCVGPATFATRADAVRESFLVRCYGAHVRRIEVYPVGKEFEAETVYEVEAGSYYC